MKNNSKIITILLIIAVLALVVIGSHAWYRSIHPYYTRMNNFNVPCSQEAKLCPDGSAVGRIAPYCEFAACPQDVPSSFTSQWLTYSSATYGYRFMYPQFAKIGYVNGSFDRPTFDFDGNIPNVQVTLSSTAGDLSVENCYKSTFGPAYTEIKVINGIPFHFGGSGDRGMGMAQESKVYATIYNDTCYQVSMITGWGRDAGDSYTKHFDQNIVDSYLTGVMSTFKFFKVGVDTAKPVVDSLVPSSGSIGSTIELHGLNFSGFEGDKFAWIENSSGVKGIIYGDLGSTDNMIRFALKNTYCTVDTSYSDAPCPSYLNIIPGSYHIFVMPWGQKSNSIPFTVQTSLGTTLNLKTYTEDPFGFSFEYPSTWAISRVKDNLIIETEAFERNTINIAEVSGPKAEDSTGKWGYYAIYYNTTTNQWMVTRQNERSQGPPTYDAVITPIRFTAGGQPIFDGGIHHGWGSFDYIVPLTTNRFLIIRGSEPDDPAQANDNPLINLVKTIRVD